MAHFKRARLDADGAGALALQGLAFLASEPGRLGRFLALSGCGPAEIRARADTAEFQAAVLQHLLSDESLLLTFAAEAGVAVETIAPAHEILTASQ